MKTNTNNVDAKPNPRLAGVIQAAIAVVALCTAFSDHAQPVGAAPTVQAARLVVAPGSGQPADGPPRSWLSEIMANIGASEYEIRWQPGVGAHQAPNRAQNLRFTFLDNGFVVQPRTNAEPALDWQAAILVNAYGRARELRAPGTPSWTIGGRAATAASPGLTIEYSNDKNGLRQTFVLPDRPPGDGALLFLLRVEPQGLTMAVHTEEGVVSFTRPLEVEAPALFYSDLNVWDHDGQSLAAWFQPVDDTSFAIVVDDSLAQYPIVVDPLTYTATKEGDQAGALYGASVASAGDVNGDGYSDVIIGASSFDSGQTEEGKVFVYHGSSSGLATTASWTAEANQDYANMGGSVASAGDVNGDGYSDVIVGAERYLYESISGGAAFVWFGGSGGLGANGTPGNADWIRYGSQTSDALGRAVACAGDVNGDGYSDILVSAPYVSSYYHTHDGAVWVFHGSSSGPGGPSRTYYGGQDYADFGSCVAGGGDVNGDGYSDIIVSAPYYDGGNTDEGRVFVYHGSSTGLSYSSNWTADSDQDSARLGSEVSSAGDVNGDGYSDIIVGAPGYEDTPSNEGKIFVWYGGSGGLGSNGTPDNADWKAQSDQLSANLGESVASAGDVNGDGYADIIVGAPYYDDGQANEGLAFVWLGGSSGLGTDGTPANADWVGQSDQAGARFGTSVACAGDVDGNGRSDIIVGAPYYDADQTDEGAAFVFQGYPDGLALGNAWSVTANQQSAELGWSVASAGDVNGDGYSDVIVGAYKFDNGQQNEGRVFVFHGGASGLSASADWTAESDQQDAWFGYGVAAAGDVNDDGYGDILVGSPTYANGQSGEGRAFVWHGSSTGLGASGTPGNVDWKAESDQASANLGNSVASAGDVNGDGYGDIIVGALHATNGENSEGRVFVWHGGSSGLGADGTPANADWKAESNQASSQFGVSVACAGDVDRNGCSDIIVGANLYDNGQENEGRVFVWYGNSTTGLGSDGTPANVDWSKEGDLANGDFGWSVASAGDVNGDGYSDVIIGAPLYDSGQAPLDEGAFFVWHGGSGGLSTGSTARTVSGGQANGHYGVSVATAGDVNGDGFSDVIVGADTYDATYSDDGIADVYHGSSSGLPSSWAWSVSSGQQDAKLGRSVAAAGDVNGDGYGDVIVGANLYDVGTTDEGIAAVYYGNLGDGMDYRPRQWRTTDHTTPIVAPLRTVSTSQVDLGLTGRTFYGRGDVKAQFEVKALGSAFDGSSLNETASWTDTGTGGASITSTIGSLSNNTFYKWRGRIKYRFSDGAVQPFSHWFFIPANGLTESDLQVRN